MRPSKMIRLRIWPSRSSGRRARRLAMQPSRPAHRSPARARIGGTLVELSVVEGDEVTAGQELARIVDDKLDFQLAALSAQREALSAQLANAEADLQRGEDLLKNGNGESETRV